MNESCFIVDAFCSDIFAGNSAAVVILEEKRSADWMQAVAAEFQLSETAFLASPQNQHSQWKLRWFTPETEVALCGHATLASAHVLWQQLGVAAEKLRFDTQSGVLWAQRQTAAGIFLDFPVAGRQALPTDRVPKDLQLPISEAFEAGPDLMLVLEDKEALRGFRPDAQKLLDLPWRGLIITAAGAGDTDFVSRFFAPKVGILEDPVTGSVHCALAPYWGERLGKAELIAEQWSRRGGRLQLGLKGDRVSLGGKARSFLSGSLS